MTIHDSVKAYFEPKVQELAGNILSFNFSPESDDSFALVTNYAGKVIKEYINGDKEKTYGFAIVIVKSYSTDGDDLNLQCMNFVQQFMEWLESQEREKKYPVFPENCKIEKMEVLQNMPNLAGVNAEEGWARYMVQCQITYKEIESDPLGL